MHDSNVMPDVSAERAVLGAMLQDNRVIPDVALIVRAGDFRSYAHQVVFEAIMFLHERGQPADKVTMASVMEQIIARRKQEDIPASYIAELWFSAPTPSNADHYARLVRDRAILHQLHQAANDIAKAVLNPTAPPEQILTEAEQAIFRIAQTGMTAATAHMRDALSEEMDRLDRLKTGEIAGGLPTGLIDLDNLTGGLHNGELLIVAARPSIGKTSLGLSLAIHAALKAEAPVFFVSLEQSRTELAGRVNCAEGRINSANYRQGFLTRNDFIRIVEVRERFGRTEFHLDDSPSQSMARIAATARRLKMRHGIKLIVIDYLQLVEPDNRRETRQEQVAGISRRLKQLARELDVPVVALAQLNRGAEGQDKPRLCDLRESGAIEADADLVLLLYIPDSSQPSRIGAIVAKQRNGPTGEIPLYFARDWMTFANFEKGSDQ